MTRNLPAFSRFLEVSALCHAEQVDMTGIASDAQVPRTTAHEYFGILEDTLVAERLLCWGESKKRKPVATPKLYFFDWGVTRKLQGLTTVPHKSIVFGKAFESFIYQELRAIADYSRQRPSLHYWRTHSGDEVDFILHEEIAIEAKGKEVLHPGRDLQGLMRLLEEKKL